MNYFNSIKFNFKIKQIQLSVSYTAIQSHISNVILPYRLTVLTSSSTQQTLSSSNFFRIRDILHWCSKLLNIIFNKSKLEKINNLNKLKTIQNYKNDMNFFFKYINTYFFVTKNYNFFIFLLFYFSKLQNKEINSKFGSLGTWLLF